MRTFIFQIIISLTLGFIISYLFSMAFLQDYKEQLERDLNIHRVEMVLAGFISGNSVVSEPNQVWKLQCGASFNNSTSAGGSDDSKIHRLSMDYNGGKISAIFNEKAFYNEPIIKKLFWLRVIEGGVQALFSIIILLLILRTWTNAIQSLRWLSNQYLKGNFKARVCVSGPKEIKTLITNQHYMANEISSLITKQKLFFSSLPHDIRTPLSAIQLTSDMLNEESTSDPFLLERLSKQVKSLNCACESSLHLLSVLNKDILLNRQRVNLESILKNVLEGICFTQHIIFTNTDKWIYTDKKIVHSLLLNILSNSCRYACSTVNISLFTYPGIDVIKIIDDGPGYDSELIELFNNGLISVDSVTKDGFGIGMILIYELVKHLNGYVFIKNIPTGSEMILAMKI